MPNYCLQLSFLNFVFITFITIKSEPESEQTHIQTKVKAITPLTAVTICTPADEKLWNYLLPVTAVTSASGPSQAKTCRLSLCHGISSVSSASTTTATTALNSGRFFHSTSRNFRRRCRRQNAYRCVVVASYCTMCEQSRESAAAAAAAVTPRRHKYAS